MASASPTSSCRAVRLPVSLSDAVRALKARGLLETAVAVGACIDGDVHCVSTASALAWAKTSGYDVAVCAIGPGIVGTGTFLGHGGLAAAEAGERSGRARRGADPRRARYRRPTSASATAASLITRGAALALLPWSRCAVADEDDAEGWEEACEGLPLSHMGRGPDEDPAFFAAAFAAGRVARGMIR